MLIDNLKNHICVKMLHVSVRIVLFRINIRICIKWINTQKLNWKKKQVCIKQCIINIKTVLTIKHAFIIAYWNNCSIIHYICHLIITMSIVCLHIREVCVLNLEESSERL